MKKFLNIIFSTEFAFTMFLAGSAFKESLPFQMFDLTILFLIISFGLKVWEFLRKPTMGIEINSLSVIAWYLVTIFLFTFSLFYSDSYYYGTDKVFRFIFITGWSFIGSVLIIKDRQNLYMFIQSFIVLSVLGAIIVLMPSSSNELGFRGFGEDSYLSTGRLLGMGSVSLLSLLLYNNHKFKEKLSVFILLSITLLGLISTGSRMPVISTFAIFVFIILISIMIRGERIKLRKGTINVILIIMFMFIALYFLREHPLLATTIRRFETLLNSNSGGASAGLRIDYYVESLKMFFESPILGKGIGGFAPNYTGQDIRYYPHNIFVEFLVESGIIGLSWFVLIILVAFNQIRIALKETDPLTMTLIINFIYWFLNVLVSGDFNDNRIFFALLSITALLKNFNKNKLEQNMLN